MLSSSLAPLQKPVETRVELSHQDLDILSEIVNYATVIPETTPWNALFKAYDAILKARRIDPRQDDRCFRFLMRMGDVQGADWNDKFYNLLGRWGYELPMQMSPGGEEEEEEEDTGITAPWKAPSRSSSAQEMRSSSLVSGREHVRRGSYGDRFAHANGTHQLILHGRSSSSGRQRAQSSSSGSQLETPTTLRNRLTDSRLADMQPPRLVNTQDEKRRMDEERRKLEREEAKREFAFPLSLITEATQETPLHEEADDSSSDFGSDYAQNNQADGQHSEDRYFTESVPPVRSQDDYIRAAANAAELYNLRVRHALFRTFAHWRELTGRVYRYHEMQRQLATGQDRRSLLGQSLDIWRERLFWKARIDAYHDDCMARSAAQMLRWWKSRTREIVERRKRVNDGLMLRRYFIAWKEQAAETDRKMHEFQQRQAVRVFRNILQKVYDRKAEAQMVYKRNLAYRAYWTWYYAYYGSRASLWYQEKSITNAIAQFKRRIQTRQTQSTAAGQFHSEGLLRTTFQSWVRQLAEKRADEEMAILHRERTIMITYFRFWRKVTQLAPAVDAITDVINDRILYDHLSLWRTRLRQTRAAKQVHKISTLRSVVSTWRLELRAKAWKENDRLVKLSYGLNTIAYAWRANVLKDLCRRNLLEAGVTKLRVALERRRAVMIVAERAADMVVKHRRQTATLEIWRQRMKVVIENRKTAVAYDHHFTLARYTTIMVKEHVRVQGMNSWSTAAHYFLQTKKSLKTWQGALESLRRANRRQAYNTVVANRKKTLKSSAMDLLIDALRKRQEATRLAENFCAVRDGDTLSSLIGGWFTRTTRIAQQNALAADFRSLHLLRTSINSMTSQLARVNSLNTLAQIHSSVVQRDRTIPLLRKWNMTLFSFRTDDVKADLFHNRLQVSHNRSLFRRWKRNTKGRIEERDIEEQLRREQEAMAEEDSLSEDEYDDVRPPSIDDKDVLLEEGFSMLNIGEWMKTPPSLSSTPAPPPKLLKEYPKTPSGRAARARDMMRASTSQIPVPKRNGNEDFRRSVATEFQQTSSAPLGFGKSTMTDYRRSVTTTRSTTPKGTPFHHRIDSNTIALPLPNGGLNISMSAATSETAASRFGRSESGAWSSLKKDIPGGTLGKSARYARSVGGGGFLGRARERERVSSDEYEFGNGRSSTTAVRTDSDGLS